MDKSPSTQISEETVPHEAVLDPLITHTSATEKITGLVFAKRAPRAWWIGFTCSFLLVMLLLYSITYLFVAGIGIWGVNIPVAWGFAIVNFVWWIGIGHAGTLISAILLLMHQTWRTSINRFAEAMTLFAVACAALFPLLHLGRPWFFYWLLPYPDTMRLWPQWRSPLIWDVFAVSTYGTVSLIFWYVGLIPDLATMRDKARTKLSRVVFGIFSLGWRNSARHWFRYEQASILLAGIATPLVVSVHSVVSLDFTASLVPGWHSTIFPPYFVAGAIYSGFAMVLTLVIPLRIFYRLEEFITDRHLENMAKLMLATGMMVAYSYIIEGFISWYSANLYERQIQLTRLFGPYAFAYWLLVLTNILIPQALWWRTVRKNTLALFLIAIVVNIGMWLERFVIVVTSLHRDFLPSSWGTYIPTRWDWATYAGTIGLFLSLIFLFMRLLPSMSMFEMRSLIADRTRPSRKITVPGTPP